MNGAKYIYKDKDKRKERARERERKRKERERERERLAGDRWSLEPVSQVCLSGKNTSDTRST